MLLLSLGLSASQALAPGLTDHLAHKAAKSFFLTSGSVTAALRAALSVVNDHLHDLNQAESGGLRVAGRMMLAVLRGGDLYLAQAGAGQSIVIRPGQVNRLSSEEAADRPLGQSVSPFVRYHHLEAQSGDVILLAPHAGPQWADPTLAGLLTLDLAQAVERLAAASPNDLTGLLFRITQPGMGAPVPRGLPTGPRAASPAARSRAPARARSAPSFAFLAPVSRALAPGTRALKSGFQSLGAKLMSLVGRMAPGLVETGQPGTLSPSVLAGTAIAVPVVIVLIASVIYFQHGRGQQFQEYLGQAQAAVVAAQLQADPLQARFYWDQARGYLDQAQRYGEGEDYSLLRGLVSKSLDTIDNIARVEFRPLFSGGFGRGARLTSIAATAADLYVLDAAGPTIYHAWDTGRGYEIDKDFRCLKGAEGVEEMGTPIALAVQPEPGALGVEGVVALDGDGTLLYCAPGQTPAVSQLTPPDTGFGRIEAIAVTNDVLYVLDHARQCRVDVRRLRRPLQRRPGDVLRRVGAGPEGRHRPGHDTGGALPLVSERQARPLPARARRFLGQPADDPRRLREGPHLPGRAPRRRHLRPYPRRGADHGRLQPASGAVAVLPRPAHRRRVPLLDAPRLPGTVSAGGRARGRGLGTGAGSPQ